MRSVSSWWVTRTTTAPASAAARRWESTTSGTVRVERSGRLIGEEVRHPGEQHTGDGDALLLTAGELVRQAPLQTVQTQVVEQGGQRAPRDPAPQ
jgi:hypothetical protein